MERPHRSKPTALRVALESANPQASLEVRRLEWTPSSEKAGAALTNDNKSSPLTALVTLTLQFNNRLNCLMTR